MAWRTNLAFLLFLGFPQGLTSLLMSTLMRPCCRAHRPLLRELSCQSPHKVCLLHCRRTRSCACKGGETRMLHLLQGRVSFHSCVCVSLSVRACVLCVSVCLSVCARARLRVCSIMYGNVCCTNTQKHTRMYAHAHTRTRARTHTHITVLHLSFQVTTLFSRRLPCRGSIHGDKVFRRLHNRGGWC